MISRWSSRCRSASSWFRRLNNSQAVSPSQKNGLPDAVIRNRWFSATRNDPNSVAPPEAGTACELPYVPGRDGTVFARLFHKLHGAAVQVVGHVAAQLLLDFVVVDDAVDVHALAFETDPGIEYPGLRESSRPMRHLPTSAV